MNEDQLVNVTIRIPQRLLEYADRLAKERATTRSGFFCELLAKEEANEIQELMAEGYREMAEENRRESEEAFPLVSEAILQNTHWCNSYDR